MIRIIGGFIAVWVGIYNPTAISDLNYQQTEPPITNDLIRLKQMGQAAPVAHHTNPYAPPEVEEML